MVGTLLHSVHLFEVSLRQCRCIVNSISLFNRHRDSGLTGRTGPEAKGWAAMLGARAFFPRMARRRALSSMKEQRNDGAQRAVVACGGFSYIIPLLVEASLPSAGDHRSMRAIVPVLGAMCVRFYRGTTAQIDVIVRVGEILLMPPYSSGQGGCGLLPPAANVHLVLHPEVEDEVERSAHERLVKVSRSRPVHRPQAMTRSSC